MHYLQSSVGSALSGISGGVTVDFTGNPLLCSEVALLRERTDIDFVFDSPCEDTDNDGVLDYADAFPGDPAAAGSPGNASA